MTKQRCHHKVAATNTQWDNQMIGPVSMDSIRHKQLIDATTNFVCQSLQLLSVVDKPNFSK